MHCSAWPASEARLTRHESFREKIILDDMLKHLNYLSKLIRFSIELFCKELAYFCHEINKKCIRNSKVWGKTRKNFHLLCISKELHWLFFTFLRSACGTQKWPIVYLIFLVTILI